MKRIRTLVLSFLFACAVLFVPFAVNAGYGIQNVAAAEEDESTTDYSTKYVVLSLEGFTIGQGFYITPTRMSYEEIGNVWKQEGIDIDLSKLTVSQATYAFFKKAGLQTKPAGSSAYNDSNFYLANIKGIDKGTVKVPTALLDAYKTRNNGNDLELEEKTGTDLEEHDYTSWSGWMITVDNVPCNTSAGAYLVDQGTGADTNVLRWQFTLAGYGADIGCGFEGYEAYYVTQDKTELYTLYAENEEEIAKDASLNAELQAVMADLDASADDVAAAVKKIKALEEKQVSIKMNSSVPYMTLTDADGNTVAAGDPDSNYVYTAKLAEGTYRLSTYKMSGTNKVDMGSIDLIVTDEAEQSYAVYSLSGIACTNKDAGSGKFWQEGEDFTFNVKVVSPDNVDRHATLGLMQAETSQKAAQYAVPFYYADMVSVTVTPKGDHAQNYIEKTVSKTLTANSSYGYSISAPEARKVSVTFPEGAELRLGTLSTYYIYKDEPGTKIEAKEPGYETYEFTVGAGITYYYRVTGAGGVTYWDWFSTNKDADYMVSKADMYIGDDSFNPDTIYHDMSQNKYDVADIYLTSDEHGYLSMKKGETYSLECFRNWQAIEGTSNAKSAEPDYHYTVIDENGNPSNDVITVTPGAHSEIAEIQAKSEGTAILLVTYDAQINMQGYTKYTKFSAIWPENTGVVVVTVDKDGTAIQTNMTINEGKNKKEEKVTGDRLDAQLDVLYYEAGTDGAEYTFTPESGVSVSVLRPEIIDNKLTYGGFSAKNITRNSDGSYTVAGLTEGPNIVKVTKNGVSTYQVIRAKEVAVSYKYKDADGNEITADELTAGDSIEISYGERSEDGKRSYNGLYNPASKLAGVYNMDAAICFFDTTGTEYVGKLNQYMFASTPASQTITVTIPTYFAGDTFRLTGCLKNGIGGWSAYGSPYGSHRSVRHDTGVPVQMAASRHTAYMCNLPDVEFKLVASDFVPVTLNITDSQTKKPVTDYTIQILDEDKKETKVTDGVFKGFVGKTYSYVICASGYIYKTGTIEIPEDTDSITKTIRLTPADAQAWDGQTMTEPKQSDGVYQIGTGAELYWFANEVKTKYTINAVLTADIDLAGYKWTPVKPNSSSYGYAGTFDGQGHTVKNLYVDNVQDAGLFGSVTGQIKNLTVEGNISASTATHAGGIAGMLKENAGKNVLISNCVSKVNITFTGTSNYVYAGGIVGYCGANSDTSTNVIDNCSYYGTITAKNGSCAGGILGAMTNRNVTIKNSSNYGTVIAKNNVGGILGIHNEASSKAPAGKIIDCYNAGSVSGQTNVGGIAGCFKGKAANNAGVEMSGCYSGGEILSTSQTKEQTMFAGQSAYMTLSDSVYSCADEASSTFTEDQAVYVSPADIAAVKKLTAETVSKKADKDTLDRIAPVINVLANVPLSAEDQTFVDLYKELQAAVADQKHVKVGVYDYTATAAGIKGASENGVILDDVEVDAATAVDAVEKALKENNIPYVLADTGYGPYMESINGLTVQAEYTMSGWMFSYNKDDFSNMGLSATTIQDGDVLEFHYQLTGGDVASAYSGLPTLKELIIGSSQMNFEVSSTYDAQWNQIITYRMNGEELAGTGTENDPFIVNVDLFKDTDLTALPVSYKTEADSHYVTVDGLSDVMDLTDGVLCHVTSGAGRTAWYKITAAAETEKALTDANTKVVVADAVYTGEELKPEVKVYVNGNLITEENYDVVFENAQNAGTATCTVTGKGEFSGQVQTTFEIKKAEQQITNVPEDRKVVYGQKADIEVAAGAKTTPVLSSDKEAVVSVTEDGKLQINGIGTAVITITAPESDNYLAATASFKVTVMGDLSKATIAPVASVEYTGKVIVPELTITDGTYQLVKDVDYTVSGQRVSVGKATATIRGIDGRYAGSQTVTFEIVKAKQEIQVASKSIEVTEGTDPFVLAADGHGTLTFVSSAPAVAEIDDTGLVTVKAAGFTDITIKTAGTANYEAAETVVRLTVKKKADTEDPDKTTEDSSDSTTEEPTTEKPSTEEPTTETPDQKVTLTAKNTVVTVPSVTYTGKAQKPAVKVTVSGKALSTDDYSVAYSNNKNAGIAKVVITGKGNYTGKVESTFVIKKASQTIQKQTVYAYSKYVKMKASAKGKVTYTSSNKKIATVNKKTGFVTAKKPGKVQIKVTAAATANYKKSTGTITLIVVPATPTVKKAAAYKTKAIKVSYKKVSGASGYQITYATNKAFKNAKSTYVSGKKSSAVIKNLKKGKKYYVKVRAYKKINGKKFYSVYSGKTSVKTK